MSFDERQMKLLVILCALCLLCPACRHTEPHSQAQPERFSTDKEVLENIVGEWTSRDGAFGFPKIIIAEDRQLFGISMHGTKELIGTWDYQHHALRVTPTEARIQEARAAGYHLNAWDWFPIEYADAHELVMAPGISVAGRWTLTK